VESKTLTLDELSDLVDDLDPMEVDEVPENTGVPVLGPIPAGKYRVQLVSFDFDRDQNGDIRDKQKFVLDVRVADEENRFDGRVVRFLRITNHQKTRVNKGVTYKFTELTDLVKGFDPEFNIQNSPERAIKFLLERIADNATVDLQLDWKAFDKKYSESMNFDTMLDGTPEKKALAKDIFIRGQKNFDTDGTLINPASGNLLKANVYLRWVYIPKRG
jgi:hypothetical protein